MESSCAFRQKLTITNSAISLMRKLYGIATRLGGQRGAGNPARQSCLSTWRCAPPKVMKTRFWPIMCWVFDRADALSSASKPPERRLRPGMAAPQPDELDTTGDGASHFEGYPNRHMAALGSDF